MTDATLEEILFPKTKSATNKQMPDFDYIRKELLRNGVNKKLLWVEYCEECRMNNDDPLQYSQFCYYIQQNVQKRRATMHIPRKPGEQIEVDLAGDPAHIIDPDTGEVINAWIFVGVLTYSQYAYVEAFINEKTANWIKAHIHMFEFFGGTTPMLVSGNCTTAVNHEKLSNNRRWLQKSGMVAHATPDWRLRRNGIIIIIMRIGLFDSYRLT